MVNNKSKKNVKAQLGEALTPKAAISKRAYILLAVLSFVLIFAYWAYAVYVKQVDSMFLPSPVKTLESAKNMFLNGGFLADIRMSVQRVLIGFFISAVVGIPLGLLIGTYAPFAAFLEPFFSFFVIFQRLHLFSCLFYGLESGKVPR